MFTIQVCWSNGNIANEWLSDKDTEDGAIQEAKEELAWPAFEGDYVRILTQDCELVWDSRDPDQKAGDLIAQRVREGTCKIGPDGEVEES